MERPSVPENGKLVSTWECVTKNTDNEPEVTTLHKYEYDEPVEESQFLSQASPVRINSSRTRSKARTGLLLADVPDIHYGFRKLPDGSLQPTHQPEVMDKWLQIMKDQQPDTIILGGDILDAPQLSRFETDSNHFVDTLQLSIDGLHKYLSRLRADNPNARIINTRGNHDARFESYLVKNAKPLFGVKPANMPDSFSTNSLPFLLRLEELEIENISGPVRLNEGLITMHGEIVKPGSTAQAYLGKLATSIMFHHTHRREYSRRVFPDGKAIEAFSFGCQADTQGSVPSYYSKVDDMGFMVERSENWNNGGGFIEMSEKTGSFKPVSVPIEVQDGYEASFNGRVYQARQDVLEALRSGK